MHEQPSWGKTIGAYFLCLLVIGVTAAVFSMALSLAVGQGAYGVGGILSWICSFGCAAYYRSTGKLGAAVGIAFFIGLALGAVTAVVGPQLHQMRFGK